MYEPICARTAVLTRKHDEHKEAALRPARVLSKRVTMVAGYGEKVELIGFPEEMARELKMKLYALAPLDCLQDELMVIQLAVDPEYAHESVISAKETELAAVLAAKAEWCEADREAVESHTFVGSVDLDGAMRGDYAAEIAKAWTSGELQGLAEPASHHKASSIANMGALRDQLAQETGEQLTGACTGLTSVDEIVHDLASAVRAETTQVAGERKEAERGERKFTVTVSETNWVSYTVSAKSAEEAQRLFEEKYSDDRSDLYKEVVYDLEHGDLEYGCTSRESTSADKWLSDITDLVQPEGTEPASLGEIAAEKERTAAEAAEHAGTRAGARGGDER